MLVDYYIFDFILCVACPMVVLAGMAFGYGSSIIDIKTIHRTSYFHSKMELNVVQGSFLFFLPRIRQKKRQFGFPFVLL